MTHFSVRYLLAFLFQLICQIVMYYLTFVYLMVSSFFQHHPPAFDLTVLVQFSVFSFKYVNVYLMYTEIYIVDFIKFSLYYNSFIQ